jgi:branched-chain amino acid transport system substrate-binding protein
MRARFWPLLALLIGVAAGAPSRAAAPAPPVEIGLDLEIRDATSTSDDAILFGATRAVEEINSRGGVLGGRPLRLVTRDNRSVPARGIANLREFGDNKSLVAFLTGKFSPVALEQVKFLPDYNLIMLDPWAAADGIVNNGQAPNWAFRLSMNDSIAVRAVLNRAARKGYRKIGAILPATGWGRSNHEALTRQFKERPEIALSAVEWYAQAAEPVLVDRYLALQKAGAQVVFFVGNEREGAQLVREVAALPAKDRLPILSHWGVTGGDFPKLAGQALAQVDFSIVQTFGFGRHEDARARALGVAAMAHFKVDRPERLPSPVGIAHTYDLVHLLALAIDKAGSAERAAVRAALEELGPYEGVVKYMRRPFTATRHEALLAEDLFFAAYDRDGLLRQVK